MKRNELNIQGGDTVRLKDGRVVFVDDIHNRHIVVSLIEHYSFDDVVEIVEKFKVQ